MTKLTERQQMVLDFIRLFIGKYHYPPTRSEIAGAFGFNVSAADQYVRILEARGYITVTPRISRGVALVQTRGRAA